MLKAMILMRKRRKLTKGTLRVLLDVLTNITHITSALTIVMTTGEKERQKIGGSRHYFMIIFVV